MIFRIDLANRIRIDGVMSTAINDTHYLLSQDENGTETVLLYTGNEMLELFDAAERNALTKGLPVLRMHRHFGALRFIDMVANARKAGLETA
jgi:hypothetical protein